MTARGILEGGGVNVGSIIHAHDRLWRVRFVAGTADDPGYVLAQLLTRSSTPTRQAPTTANPASELWPVGGDIYISEDEFRLATKDEIRTLAKETLSKPGKVTEAVAKFKDGDIVVNSSVRFYRASKFTEIPAGTLWKVHLLTGGIFGATTLDGADTILRQYFDAAGFRLATKDDIRKAAKKTLGKGVVEAVEKFKRGDIVVNANKLSASDLSTEARTRVRIEPGTLWKIRDCVCTSYWVVALDGKYGYIGDAPFRRATKDELRNAAKKMLSKNVVEAVEKFKGGQLVVNIAAIESNISGHVAPGNLWVTKEHMGGTVAAILVTRKSGQHAAAAFATTCRFRLATKDDIRNAAKEKLSNSKKTVESILT